MSTNTKTPITEITIPNISAPWGPTLPEGNGLERVRSIFASCFPPFVKNVYIMDAGHQPVLSHKVNVVPTWPGWASSRRISPPRSIRTFLTMAKPSPVPSFLVETWGVNNLGRMSGDMPRPVSPNRTKTFDQSVEGNARIVSVPFGISAIASSPFLSRFKNARFICSVSPITDGS